MSKVDPIKLVQVEFLRGGPPHNQLLSPLTNYLAISGNAGAGIVKVPYEHAEFERRLKNLRYETGDSSDQQAMLHGTGTEMGRILGAVPGVPGALDSTRGETLLHLRITLSASELALLPFELAKVPVSDTVTGENWLSLQSRPPVCITRNIRTVSPEGVVWPDRPRLLFIVGDRETTPYLEHRAVMIQSIEPFRYPSEPGASMKEPGEDEARQEFGDLLTILVNPTLADIRKECASHKYTHVHVLAHGALDEVARNSYCLALLNPDGSSHLVTGDQFALALTSVDKSGVHRPTVVTLASCDSANVGAVEVPGASFAHALHQSGIPLVVASQFPLSKDGSIPLTETLYEGLLWGENPLILLYNARAKLRTGDARWHDWASVVVYEALPHAWAEQLETLAYKQSKRAVDAALQRIDLAVRAKGGQEGSKSLGELNEVLESAIGRLPLDGPYEIECLGLRASSQKRLAEAISKLGDAEIKYTLPSSQDLLTKALQYYEKGARDLLMNDTRGVQRVATLHWLLVQVASLSAIIGRAADDATWMSAKLCAELYSDHRDSEEQAWAHGSLAELWLLRLAAPGLSAEDRELFSKNALAETVKLSKFYSSSDDFPIKSTRRQLERYVQWWGTAGFEERLEGVSRSPWKGEKGLIETAELMIKELKRKSPPPRNGGSRTANAAGGSQAPESGGAATSQAQGAGGPVPSGKGRKRKAAEPPLLAKKKVRTGKFFDIELLRAGHGDALWIEYGDKDETHRILIDCGTEGTARELSQRLGALPEHERFFELFVLSHIDSDHIGGALPLLKTIKQGIRFGDVWFNGWRHLPGELGARQGEIFSTAIQELRLPWNSRFGGKAVVVPPGNLPEISLPGGMKLTLLSPTPKQLQDLAPKWRRELKKLGFVPGEPADTGAFLKGTPSQSTDVDALADTPFDGDKGEPNGSSIALLAEFAGASILLGADAHAPVLIDSIQKLLKERKAKGPLKIDAFKVPHHASQKNVSSDLIQLLECPKYLISTNGSHFSHPDRQAVARIIKHGGRDPALYFNFKNAFTGVWERKDLQEKYGYTASYPASESEGISLSLLETNGA